MHDELSRIREACHHQLAQASSVELAELLRRLGRDPVPLVQQMDVTRASQQPLVELKRAVAGEGFPEDDGAFERFIIARAALHSVDGIPATPLPSAVRQELCAGFSTLLSPPPKLEPKLRLGHTWFTSACKIATLRRFPAGDFEWEISGIPRSLLLKVDKRRLPKLLYLLVTELRGFAPFFATHLSILRPRGHLDEQVALRAYYRMALALEYQPRIKGIMGASWMRSPSLAAHSPHLAWFSTFFAQNGGFVTDAGRADPDCGVLKSTTRRRLYEEGKFVPYQGFGIWPRQAMLRWAASHPEYAP